MDIDRPTLKKETDNIAINTFEWTPQGSNKRRSRPKITCIIRLYWKLYKWGKAGIKSRI